MSRLPDEGVATDDEPSGKAAAADPALPVGIGTAPPRARSAVLWSYALTIGRFGITGIVFVWLATLITPSDFGEMALAMVWVVFAQMLAFFGPAQAVVQRPRATQDHFTAAFWMTLAVSVVLAAAFVVLAPVWASVNDDSRLTALCWALAPTIVLNALMVVPDAALRRQMLFKRLSLRVLLAGLASGTVGVTMAWAGYGVWALVGQQLTLSAFSAIAIWLISPWRPSMRFSRSAARDLRSFSFRSVAEFTAHYASTRTDVLVLGMVFSPAVIGLYRFGVRITDMVTEVAAGGLGQVSLPHLARFHEDRRSFAKAFSKMAHAGAVLAWPTFATLAVSAPAVLEVIGAQWVPLAPALQVMCADAAFGVLGAVLAPATQASGRPGLNALVGWIQAAVTAAVIIGVGWSFVHGSPTSQALAIAVTFFIVRATFLTVMGVITLKMIFMVPLRMLLGRTLPALFAGIVALGAGFAARLIIPAWPPIVEAVVVAGTAGAAAAAVLITSDTLVRDTLRRLAERIGVVRPAEASTGSG